MSLNCGSLDPIQSLTLKNLTLLGNFYGQYLFNRSGVELTIYKLKVFTSSPVLADMEIGELAIGDGTGGTAQDEWFFKPDASKIVALDHEGNARTITT